MSPAAVAHLPPPRPERGCSSSRQRRHRFTAGAHLAALLLLWTLAAGCTARRGASAEGTSLRVLVLNLHAGQDAEGRHSLERVAALVRELRADVVMLQEIDRGTERSGHEDQLATLRALTGMEGAFGRTIHFQGGEYGLGLLTRWPLRSDRLHPLPVEHASPAAAQRYEPRGALHVEVAARFGTLHLVNTHLDHTPGDGPRLQEVATVRAVADSLRRMGGTILVGGDLNVAPDSPVIAVLSAGGWRDAWPECGQGPGHTFPAQAPDRRIDYLFLPPGVTCESAAVIDSRASDHRPVFFRLRVVDPADR